MVYFVFDSYQNLEKHGKLSSNWRRSLSKIVRSECLDIYEFDDSWNTFIVYSAEKRRIVLERAVKLREQRKESKAKQEIIQKRREDAFQRYKYLIFTSNLTWS